MGINKVAAKVALKRIKKSATVWTNTAIALFSMLMATAELQFHLMKDVLGDKWPIAMFGIAMVNVVLRFRTEFKYVKPQIEAE